MADSDNLPWPDLPDREEYERALAPADLTTWPRTLLIIAGVVFSSGLIAWALWALMGD